MLPVRMTVEVMTATKYYGKRTKGMVVIRNGIAVNCSKKESTEMLKRLATSPLWQIIWE